MSDRLVLAYPGCASGFASSAGAWRSNPPPKVRRLQLLCLLQALVGMMVRIVLVDDHEVVRKGIRLMLEAHRDWQVCGEAANGREAVKLVVQLKPDIVVMDLEMPELNGLEATRQIKKELPSVEVLIYTMHETEELIREMLLAGARGYVFKTDMGRHLVEARSRNTSLSSRQRYPKPFLKTS